VEARRRGARLSFERDEPEFFATTLRKMIADGVTVTEFHREARKLEDAFVDILKNIAAPPGPPPLPPS
jgi:ABC-2 type transport system ATP-binding protein